MKIHKIFIMKRLKYQNSCIFLKPMARNRVSREDLEIASNEEWEEILSENERKRGRESRNNSGSIARK
jgi:hypothetical protein